jgi:hypothetical protein
MYPDPTDPYTTFKIPDPFPNPMMLKICFLLKINSNSGSETLSSGSELNLQVYLWESKIPIKTVDEILQFCGRAEHNLRSKLIQCCLFIQHLWHLIESKKK